MSLKSIIGFAAFGAAFAVDFLHSRSVLLDVYAGLFVALIVAACACIGAAARGPRLRPLAISALLLLFIDLNTDAISHLYFRLRTDAGAPLPAAIGVILFSAAGVAYSARKLLPRFFDAAALVLFATSVGKLVIFPGAELYERKLPSISPAASEHPSLVILVLDEHIGVEGMRVHPPLHDSFVAKFLPEYLRRGFDVYGNAYSNFHGTLHSISSILDARLYSSEAFSSKSLSSTYTFPEPSPKLLADLLKKRPALHVYQSSYFDYCSTLSLPLQKCLVFKIAGLGSLERAGFPVGWWKLPFLGHQVLGSAKSTTLKVGLRKLFGSEPYEILTGVLHTQQVLDTVARDFAEKSRGAVFFAHLFAPHFSYLLKPDCTLAPWKEWVGPREDVVTDARLQAYTNQLHCTQRQVLAFVDKIISANPQAEIYIFGDHGARFDRLTPEVNAAVVVNNFSAFLAARRGVDGAIGRYDTTLVPLTSAVGALLDNSPVPAVADPELLWVFNPHREPLMRYSEAYDRVLSHGAP